MEVVRAKDDALERTSEMGIEEEEEEEIRPRERARGRA